MAWRDTPKSERYGIIGAFVGMGRAHYVAVLLLTGIMATAAVAQEAERIRFSFLPALGEEIVYRVDYRAERKLGSIRAVVDWSHEVRMTVAAEETDGYHSGTFSIANVSAREGAARDIDYLIAKAVEGETYALKWLYGVPVEVDWQPIKARLLVRLPQVADATTAAAIVHVLPLFEADAVKAVLRPFCATGIGYLRAFNVDGTVAVYDDMNLPSWFEVPGSVLKIRGGTLEDTDDMLMIWNLVPDAEAAAAKLGPEMRGIAASVTDPADRIEVQGLLDKALAGGVEVVEGGVATWDPTPGLMRSFELGTRIVAGDFRRDGTILITRLAPD